MIPRAGVVVSWDVKYSTLIEPSADDIAYGGFATRAYAGSLVVAATWEDATEWLTHERAVLARVAAAAHDAEEFDELAKVEESEAMLWDPAEGPVAAPDLGMLAACLALCAAGCATAASCRGHVGDNAWSNEPVILFTADAARARLLEDVGRTTRCGLASADNGRLSLYARSIEEVLEFAALLIERRAQFDVLPLPAALAEARGLGDVAWTAEQPPEQIQLF